MVLTESERISWERALERIRRQLAENKEPKLAERLKQEIAIINNFLRAYGGRIERV